MSRLYNGYFVADKGTFQEYSIVSSNALAKVRRFGRKGHVSY